MKCLIKLCAFNHASSSCLGKDHVSNLLVLEEANPVALDKLLKRHLPGSEKDLVEVDALVKSLIVRVAIDHLLEGSIVDGRQDVLVTNFVDVDISANVTEDFNYGVCHCVGLV